MTGHRSSQFLEEQELKALWIRMWLKGYGWSSSTSHTESMTRSSFP